MSETPYRKQADRPVCADCKHRRDGNMMDEDRPWMDWFCMVTPGHERASEYNPITGITTPGETYDKRCHEVNKGECEKFERIDAKRTEQSPRPPPQTEPRADPDSWLVRYWRRRKANR